MGNCLRNNNVTAQKEEQDPPSKLETKNQFHGGGRSNTKKMIKIRAVSPVEAKAGVLRMKVVLTQEELKQLLNYTKDLKNSSVEHLVTAMKMRGRRIYEVRRNDEGDSSNWRPALESIPEDH